MPRLAALGCSVPFAADWNQVLVDAVTDLQWSADGSALFAGDATGRVVRFASSGDVDCAWQAHEGGVTRLQLRPGQQDTLASAGEDGRVVLWDSRSGEQRALLSEEGSWVEHLAWTPDGSVLATAARKTISLWRDEESLGVWYDGRRQILAMAWAPDGRRLATAANKGLYVWRLDRYADGEAEPMQLLSFPGAPVSVAWQKKGRALAVGTQDGFLQVWRQGGQSLGPGKQSGAKQLTMRGYPGKVSCLAWHPSLPLIATAGGPELVLWPLPGANASAKSQPLRHHRKTLTAIAWSEQGEYLAAGDRSGHLSIWRNDGTLVFALDLHAEVACLSWRPASNYLTVGDTAGNVMSVRATDSTETSPSGMQA